MKAQEHQPRQQGSPENQPAFKKPYEKPKIIYRAPLEAMAGYCGSPPVGKANPAQCRNNPYGS